MGFGRLHHVALVVADLDAAIAQHEHVHGAVVLVRKELPEQAVAAAALALPGDAAEVELIAPLPGVESGVARFLARRGEGLHHVAWAVPDVASELERLHAAGLRLIDQTPRPGLHGVPVAFVHPAGMNGVLTELVEDSPLAGDTDTHPPTEGQ